MMTCENDMIQHKTHSTEQRVSRNIKSTAQRINTSWKRLYTLLGTAALLLLAPPAQAALNGNHDAATCTVISGWAWDSTLPTTPISVAVYDNTTLLTTVLAGNFRQDLLNGGIGDGKHGFSLPPPVSLFDGKVHTINLKYAGTTTNLNATNKTLQCTPVAPSAPTGVVAVAGDKSATVAFTAPSNNGGSVITGYTVISNPAGGVDSNAGSTGLSHTITGLTNGTSYTFTAKATTAIGTSPASTASNSIVPATVPNAPTAVTAKAGAGQAIVSFTAPTVNGGYAISGYTVISNPAGGVDSHAGMYMTSHVVTGLTNGQAYTFTVVAINAKGSSVPSTASTSITPVTIPTVTLSSTNINFGNQAMNTVSVAQPVTLTNTGTTAVTVSIAGYYGPNPGQFSTASSSNCAKLTAGSSCHIDPRFSPTMNQAGGIKSAVLAIGLTDGVISTTQTVSLTGTTVTAPATTAILSSGGLTFSTVALTPSAPQSVTLTNTGTLPLNLYAGSITRTGSSPGQFTLLPSSSCIMAAGVSLAAGASCTVDVQYTPSVGAVLGTSYVANVSFDVNTLTPLVLVVTGSLKTVQAYYIYSDHLDTPRQITDTAGNTVWQWDNSDPFGNNSPNENPSGQGTFTNNLRFPGQYFDKETNTHYNINRDYDPATGRYIQSDLIGLAGGSDSTYIYANSNPLRYTDPTGLCPWCPLIIPLLEIGMLANDAATGDDVPIPGGGAAKGAKKAGEAASCIADETAKKFSKEKQALIDMAKADKKAGMTAADMQAYKDLNKQLPDPFPSNKVRGPESHNSGAPSSQAPHGHVGPVDHIPVRNTQP